MESSLFWLLLRGLWKTLQNPPKLRKSVSTQRGLGLDHRMLVDGMREDARGITATFHCLQGHREKAEADSSWGCTMKGQEAKATSFSNGNPNWILGICFFFFSHHSVYIQEQEPSKGWAELQTLQISQEFWFIFEFGPALSKSLQDGPPEVTSRHNYCPVLWFWLYIISPGERETPSEMKNGTGEAVNVVGFNYEDELRGVLSARFRVVIYDIVQKSRKQKLQGSINTLVISRGFLKCIYLLLINQAFLISVSDHKTLTKEHKLEKA